MPSDEPITEEPATPAPEPKPAPKTKAKTAAQEPEPPSREPEKFSAEYVRELREESKGYRLKLHETEQQKQDALKAVAEAKKEGERANTEAKAAADQRVIRAELKAAALKAGMIDLDGLKLADLSKVKLSESGEIEGADALMTELKAAKPYLFGSGSTSSTSTPPPAREPEPKKVKDMNREEYESYKREQIKAARKK